LKGLRPESVRAATPAVLTNYPYSAKPFRIVGIPDEETVTGAQADIFRHYGISMEGLSETAGRLIKK